MERRLQPSKNPTSALAQEFSPGNKRVRSGRGRFRRTLGEINKKKKEKRKKGTCETGERAKRGLKNAANR